MGRTYEDAVRSGELMLTDAAINTRLMLDTPVVFDPEVKAASALVDGDKARLMRTLFVGYATVAREFGLPILLYSPTSRATPGRLRRSGFADAGPGNLNERGVRLVSSVRARVSGVEAFVAGVVGVANDAYRPDQALSTDDARVFHAPQARMLAEADADVLLAGPLPSTDEAAGAAQAMAATGTPYAIAFVLDPAGDVLDQVPLADAVERLDNAAAPPPVHYIIQCVHPRIADLALAKLSERGPAALGRVRAVKANGADLSLAELDRSARPRSDDPEPWAEALWRLRERYGTPILGGCCGTDERHLFSLALRMAGGLCDRDDPLKRTEP